MVVVVVDDFYPDFFLVENLPRVLVDDTVEVLSWASFLWDWC